MLLLTGIHLLKIILSLKYSVAAKSEYKKKYDNKKTNLCDHKQGLRIQDTLKTRILCPELVVD
jgi:hypothetical protein